VADFVRSRIIDPDERDWNRSHLSARRLLRTHNHLGLTDAVFGLGPFLDGAVAAVGRLLRADRYGRADIG